MKAVANRRVARPWIAASLVGVGASILLLTLFPPAYVTSQNVLHAPGSEHLLGTNDIGQSVMAGLARAAPTTIALSLITGIGATFLALVAAVVVTLAGRVAGAAVLRVIDLLQVIPSILILLLVASWYQPGFIGLVIVLVLTTWHDDVRVLRALVERESTRDSTRLARQMGAGPFWCLRHHVLPGLRSALAALYAQNCLQAGMRAAGLGFLGLTDPRLLTWGTLMNDGLEYLHSPAAIWLLLPPLIALTGFFGVLIALSEITSSEYRVRGNHD